jgi:hypothetical protein
MKLGIVGRMASGKTTVANNLCEHYGFVRYSLASKLKEMCELHKPGWSEQEAYPMLMKHLQDLFPGDDFRTLHSLASDIITVFADIPVVDGKNRRLLQVVGTDVIRKISPDVWTNYLIRYIDGQMPPNAVVDDVRFRNEAELLRAHRYRIIKLEVPEEERILRLHESYGRPPTDEELNHPSEAEVDTIPDEHIDYVLRTDGPKSEQLVLISAMLGGLL